MRRNAILRDKKFLKVKNYCIYIFERKQLNSLSKTANKLQLKNFKEKRDGSGQFLKAKQPKCLENTKLNFS